MGGGALLLLTLLVLSRRSSESSTSGGGGEGLVVVQAKAKPTPEEQVRRAGAIASEVVDAADKLKKSLADLFGEK